MFSTAAQQHQFNYPFQLGCSKLNPETDSVNEIQRYDVSIFRGDALIIGSDGLCDYVFLPEIGKYCEELLTTGGSAQELAERITGKAYEHSKDEDTTVHFHWRHWSFGACTG